MNQAILDSFEYKTEAEWYVYLQTRLRTRQSYASLLANCLRHHAAWERMGLVIPESMRNRAAALLRLQADSESGGLGIPAYALTPSESTPDAS